ncbi:MAG: DNA-protecting protein DprA [Acidimicrobiia bacterium]|nr:DNA-protecting protein DprA [Acidimicrobiia bacterium]
MATHLDGVAIITPDDEGYPHERLRSGAALPVILWVRGDPSLMSSPSLGISGSRASSAAAIELAAEIAMAAAREGVTVVTGGAAGVDSAAHRAAIDAGGTAVVVLAEGLGSSWFDPDDSVTVISEFPPGTPWMPRQAMQRNETIAALSDAVVVVACDVTGGSWAQGRLCLKKGVPLLVPGLPVDMAPGNLALLNERAGKAKDRIAVAFEPDDPEAPLRHLRAFRDAPESALGPTEQMTLLG